MKIKVTKNTALTQLFYYTGMAGLLACLVANLILIVTAISEGIPIFVLLFITGVGSFASSFVDFGPLGTLLIFIIEWRWKLLFLGLILMVVQAWLKHDADIRLTFSNFFARPVSNGAVHPETHKEDKKSVSRDSLHDRTHTDTITSDDTTKRKEADTESASGSLTIRMNTSKTSSTGKGMKHLGDL